MEYREAPGVGAGHDDPMAQEPAERPDEGLDKTEDGRLLLAAQLAARGVVDVVL